MEVRNPLDEKIQSEYRTSSVTGHVEAMEVLIVNQAPNLVRTFNSSPCLSTTVFYHGVSKSVTTGKVTLD